MAKKKATEEATFEEAVIDAPEPMPAAEAVKRTGTPKHAKTPKHAAPRTGLARFFSK